jgi:hypothetical protein
LSSSPSPYLFFYWLAHRTDTPHRVNPHERIAALSAALQAQAQAQAQANDTLQEVPFANYYQHQMPSRASTDWHHNLHAIPAIIDKIWRITHENL